MSTSDRWADLLAMVAGGFELEDSSSIAIWTVLTASMLVPIVILLLVYQELS